MSIGPSRLIYVDDTSALISYQGPWAEGDMYSVNTQFGRSFNNTLHVLPGSGNFTFNFTGYSVAVMGSFQAFKLPSWTCYLDGYVIPSNNISSHSNMNAVEICSQKGIIRVLQATFSTLTVAASGTADNPFLFDRIQYEPDATAVLDNATVVVDAFCDQIQYGPGWNKLGTTGMMTLDQGASMTFDFVGIQITWISTVAFNSNISQALNASAQYSIDNGTLFQFPVAAQISTIQEYNLVSFQTPQLSPGSHRLFVEYGADNSNDSAPLVLDYFIIQNLTIPSFTPSAPNTTSTTSQIVHHAGLSEQAIVGIVIGSLVGLVLVILGLARFIKAHPNTFLAELARRFIL